MEQLGTVMQSQNADAAMETLRGILDNFDLDKSSRGIARANGVPATWLRSEDDVKEIRQQRAQQQQLMQISEQMPNMAKAYASGTKAPEDGSISKELMNAA
jgi:hypothetical protein